MKILFFLFIAGFFFFAFPQQAFGYTFVEEPTHIIIPSLSLSLPITTAKIVYDTWDVSVTSISFGETSTLPGNRGNTIIFGHALPELFVTLPLIQKGEYVHVFTNNDWFVYKITTTTTVNPEDVHVLMPQNSYELTLYTCVGANYERRFVAKAELVSDKSL